MHRKSRWLKKTFRNPYLLGNRRHALPHQNVIGVVLCVLGIVVIIKAIPAWLYFVLAGLGFMLLGFSFFRD